MTLRIGSRLGPYEICRFLGAGGMGVVYGARDTRLNRMVAIKLLLPGVSQASDFLARFHREAHVIARLHHPNICSLYDIGQVDSQPYLVMELLDGETLAARIERSRLPLDEVTIYAIQIASALQEAHAHGIVHRDLKPGNMMLTRWGVKLMDFGIAKAHWDDENVSGTTARSASKRSPSMLRKMLRLRVDSAGTTATMTGSRLIGTLPYMAPEQIRREGADLRTDVFAFGAVLFEMCTGRRAFNGSSKQDLTNAILSTDPPRLSLVRRDAGLALEQILDRCLAKNPENRFASAAELLAELKWVSSDLRTRTIHQIVATLDGASPPGAPMKTRSRLWPRSAKGWVPALGAVALIICGIVIAGTFGSPDSVPWSNAVFAGEVVYVDTGAAIAFARGADLNELLATGRAFRADRRDQAHIVSVGPSPEYARDYGPVRLEQLYFDAGPHAGTSAYHIPGPTSEH